jgi:hypothetical protein
MLAGRSELRQNGDIPKLQRFREAGGGAWLLLPGFV